ncbi:MAG: SRPBCC family protein [Nitriliruptorales bacterium]|nr:SRPBCC family protein [Nitriliruptorales bacterium]
MPVMERSAVVPLPLDEAWEAFFGDEMQNWVRLSDSVVAVREYEMRPDGTPEYVMVNRAGPMNVSHRSDYEVYDPPRRAEDDTLESSLGGRFITMHEPVAGGTRVTHRWDVEPHGVMRLLFPLMRRRMERAFQADLDQMVDRIRQVR